MTKQKSNKSLSNILWDTWCTVSIVGIWPRFIATRLLSTTHLEIPIASPALDGLRILQISDLHIKPSMPAFFLDKIRRKVQELSPDVIVFTGDFLSYAILDQPERLQQFLNGLKAPYGCFAVLGNHDYQNYISIGEDGSYHAFSSQPTNALKKGFKRLFSISNITGKVDRTAHTTPPHAQLLKLLEKTPFQLLHNATKTIPIKNGFLNICGLGEHTAGRCLPDEAFKDYDPNFPGVILLHNPDGVPSLKKFPGNLVLCGHTHGGQVNLPGLTKKFMLVENPHLKRGLFFVDNKWIYVNRGLGSVMPFRWFSRPEITLIKLCTTSK